RFLPAMHHVPALGEQAPQAGAVDEKVDATGKVSGQGEERAPLIGTGLQANGAQVLLAVKDGRRHRGDFPALAAGAGHFVGQPAVVCHDVRMRDRKELSDLRHYPYSGNPSVGPMGAPRPLRGVPTVLTPAEGVGYRGRSCKCSIRTRTMSKPAPKTWEGKLRRQRPWMNRGESGRAPASRLSG